jgi:hypothetical protein
MVKSRKTLTEPEVQFYMYQLVQTMHHLHSENIIHRGKDIFTFFRSLKLIQTI